MSVQGWTPSTKNTRRFLLISLGIALLIAGVVSFYASSHPDGLEFVAQTTGFGDTARDSASAAGPLAGYAVAGLDNAQLSGGLAGVLGVLVVLAIAGGLARLLRRRSGAGSQT